MGERRDAERTRAKIMAAAREEFAAHGLAGARIEAIARRAGIAKQLIYHYFSGKEALFEATLESKYRQHRAASPGEGPGALFRHRFEAAAHDPVWMRFLTWEAAEHPESGRIVAEDVRREAIARQAALIAQRQAGGELPADLDPALLQLAIYALAIYPLAFGQVTRMITDRSPEDPRFQADWAAFLTELGARLAPK
ncbi:AcrR family transcriptional regulator [Caulobacter ginsengisoli]|uniref:AcrR family transcriptional regulator n=1 Tax=Caulobacter ginsengisoli TaxID=400775 RepID=A0ABU0INE1_9CAUL|nr:TetR family transcriptional regulator [Caulobacter ginsengisoli]MDQ0463521.1 AcrR family transcriptional regulator [Caulobacter ginsengisoli]